MIVESPPVLIIAYMRDRNVIGLIEALVRANVTRIYVAIDGPRNQGNSAPSKRLSNRLKIFASLNSLQLFVWERESNLGPAVSVVTAIEWFFAHEESGVILEDDLRISTDSIRFFSKALDTFALDKSIGVISGSNYWEMSDITGNLPFASYPLTWGWATWKDRWVVLRKPFYQDSRVSLDSLPLVERLFWKNGVERCMNRKLDAWDIPFAANFRSMNLRSIIAPINLVTNIGFDEHAGNTFKNVWPLNIPIVRDSYDFSEMSVSSSIDLTQRIAQDVYHISMRSVVVRPIRLIQNFLRSREANALQRSIKSIMIP